MFASSSSLPLSSQVELHTWLDCTLQELTALLLTSLPSTLVPPEPLSRTFSFCLVYPDVSGQHVMREVGRVQGLSGGTDADKTLRELKLEIGDFLNVAILPPPTTATTPTAEVARG